MYQRFNILAVILRLCPLGFNRGLFLSFLLALITTYSGFAQRRPQHIVIEQCETIEFSVVEWPGDRYTWDLYTELQWDSVNFATQKGNVEPAAYFDNGMYQGSTVKVHWLDTGRYFLRIMVWDEKTCTNNLVIFIVDVIEHVPEAMVIGESACYGDPVVFKVVLTGMGPWDLEYTYGDGTATVNVNGITEPEHTIPLPPLPPGSFDVWVTQIIDQCAVNLMPSEKARIVIYPIPTYSKIYPVEK